MHYFANNVTNSSKTYVDQTCDTQYQIISVSSQIRRHKPESIAIYFHFMDDPLSKNEQVTLDFGLTN